MDAVQWRSYVRMAALGGIALLGALRLDAQTAKQPGATTAAAAADVKQANDDLARGDYAAALTLLTTLNQTTPRNPEILYDLGMTQEALHPEAAANPEAEADYRAAIAANPVSPLPHVALGLMLARSNRASEAREQLQAAIGLPDAPPELKARSLRALARLDLAAKTPGTASGELAAALQMTPETSEDTLLAAEIAEATPDLPAAEQAYRRYLASRPKDATATSALAHVLVAERRPADAESLLTQALGEQPGDPSLTAQMAATLLGSGDPTKVERAAPLLETLHAAHPEDRNVARLLARVYLETGHPDQADAAYVALLSGAASPGDPTLLADRAEALLRLHRPAEAERLLKQAVADPRSFASKEDFGDTAMRLAFAAQEIDDPRGALQALQLRATVLQPSLASLFLEATARDALHQSSQAVDLYKRFLGEAHGTLPEQESKARERIAALGGRR